MTTLHVPILHTWSIDMKVAIVGGWGVLDQSWCRRLLMSHFGGSWVAYTDCFFPVLGLMKFGDIYNLVVRVTSFIRVLCVQVSEDVDILSQKKLQPLRLMLSLCLLSEFLVIWIQVITVVLLVYYETMATGIVCYVWWGMFV